MHKENIYIVMIPQKRKGEPGMEEMAPGMVTIHTEIESLRFACASLTHTRLVGLCSLLVVGPPKSFMNLFLLPSKGLKAKLF